MDLVSRFTERLELEEGVVPAIEPVDALTFAFGEQYLHLPQLFPSQSLALKLYYRLWEQHPFSAEEQALLKLLESKWGLTYDLERLKNSWTELLLLVWGRRSSKSSLVGGIIINYEIYKLICKGNPQRHYGILQGDTIYLQVTAAKEDQAKKTFSLGSELAKSCPFLRPYIDNRKDLETELRFFTPYDLVKCRRVRARNRRRDHGQVAEKPPLGSVVFWTTTTAAGTSRGGATIVQVFEEFAHVRRARMQGDEEVSSSGMSDYALYKALSPATKTFGRDGKLIEISSPREEGGEFYRHYCQAKGCAKDGIPPNPNYLVLQLATWEANPNIRREDLENEFRSDPLGATQEYGAEFGKPAAAFIPLDKIRAMVQPNRPIMLQGDLRYTYVVTVDPAKDNDTYAVCWAHSETTGTDTHYYIDGLMGWMPQIERGADGGPRTVPIDPIAVLNFIVDLCTRALARRVRLIAYDQWSSSDAIARLQQLRLPAMETTFTNAYKALIYRDFLEEINHERVHVYGVEASPQYNWVEQLLLELQYLQRIVRGDTIVYHHPSSGPVQHDDLATVVAHAVSLLKRFRTGSRDLYDQLRRQGMGPMRIGHSIVPVRGARIH